MTESTITSVSLGRRAQTEPRASPQAHLVVLLDCDDVQAPSSRHVLDDVDGVRFGRGERSATRASRILTLRFPDRRMSTQHGTLRRTPEGWQLDDPDSKNGAIVDGKVVRKAVLHDGQVIELGHTVLVYRDAVIAREREPDLLESDLSGPAVFATFDGELAEQFGALERIAATDVSVLLEGDTGTGKELVARAIHEVSARKGAFVGVNCGALPTTLIEGELFGYKRGAFTGANVDRQGFIRSADGGTLFLDEVAELPAPSQATFLRVLQEREVTPLGFDRAVKVDLRLIAATLSDLESLVAANKFRRDLYARLFGFTMELPRLRERLVDFGLLARRLLATIPSGKTKRIAPAAVRALLAYDWPYHIRELEKVLVTAVALAPSDTIELAHLPEAVRNGPAPSSPPVVERDETDELRDRLVALLVEHRGNVVAVSKAMRTRRTQIYRWLQRYALDVERYRR